jgi:hypothetical protein
MDTKEMTEMSGTLNMNKNKNNNYKKERRTFSPFF